VKEIGNSAFSHCNNLKTIKGPKQLQKHTYKGEDGEIVMIYVTEVIVADGVETIKYCAFSGCKALKSIQIPDTVKKIEDYAFDGCINLKTIKLPKQLEFIGRYAFFECESLTDIYIPDTVKEIGNHAFNKCINLKIINILPLNTYGIDVFANCDCLLTGSPVKYDSSNDYITNNEEVYEWLLHRWDDAPLHRVCNNATVILQDIEECIAKNGEECTRKVDNVGITAWNVISTNMHAIEDCKRRLRPTVAKKKAITGGVTDDPNNGADRLLYKRYANALVNVAKQAEVGKSPLVIGISAPWGVGKTKLWNLIKDILVSGNDASPRNESEEKRKKAKSNLSALNKLASALELAFCVICLLIEALIRSASCNTTYEPLNYNDEESQAAENADSNLETNDAKSQHYDSVTFWVLLTLPIWLPFTFPSLLLWFIIRSSGWGEEWWGEEWCDELEEGLLRFNLRNVLRRLHTSLVLLSALVIVLLSPLVIVAFPTVCSFRILNITSKDLNALKNNLKEKNALSSKILCTLTGERPLFYAFKAHIAPCSIFACVRIALLMTVQVVAFTCKSIWPLTKKLCSFIGCRTLPSPKRIHHPKHIYVEFNAWVFNGSDILWASLMETLWTSVEEEFGTFTVRSHRASIALSDEKSCDSPRIRSNKRDTALFQYKMKLVIFSILALIGVGGGIYIILALDPQIPGCKEKCNGTAINIGGIFAITLSSLPFLTQLPKFFSTILPQLRSSCAEILKKQALSGVGADRQNFTADKGFMGIVKKEVEYLYDFIQTVPKVDVTQNSIQDTRICMFVDDLDRCDAKTVVDVLQAVQLLMDKCVTCWIALDTRIVTSSINEVFSKVFEQAGVDGYDFLEKIIQVPFCIPNMTTKKKLNLMNLLCFEGSNSLNSSVIYDKLRLLRTRMNGVVMDMNVVMGTNNQCYMPESDIRMLQKYESFPIRGTSTGQVNVRAIAKCLVKLYPTGLIPSDRDLIERKLGVVNAFGPNPIIERGLVSESLSDVDEELILGAITGYIQYIEDLVADLYNGEKFKGASIALDTHENENHQCEKAMELSSDKRYEESNCVTEINGDEKTSTESFLNNLSITRTEGDERSDSVTKSNVGEEIKSNSVIQGVEWENGLQTTDSFSDNLSITRTKGDEKSDSVTKSNVGEEIKSNSVIQGVEWENGLQTTDSFSDNLSITRTKGDEKSDSVTKSNVGEEIKSNSVIQGVEWENGLQTMFQLDEIKCFRSLAEYFSGRPRSMGRVINSFNVSRSIVIATLSDVPDPSFYRNLLKLILMVEIWPYRTSWLLLVAENILQQRKLERKLEHVKNYTALENSLPLLLQKLYPDHTTVEDIMQKVSLFEVYDKVIKVLMFSPEKAEDEMARDGDPQLFQLLLAEDCDHGINDNCDHGINDMFTLSDIIPIQYEERFKDVRTLVPFVFNLPTHVMEKASNYIENIVIFSSDDNNQSPSKSKICFQRKGECLRELARTTVLNIIE